MHEHIHVHIYIYIYLHMHHTHTRMQIDMVAFSVPVDLGKDGQSPPTDPTPTPLLEQTPPAVYASRDCRNNSLGYVVL